MSDPFQHPPLEVMDAMNKKAEALTRARSLIERKPCTTDMQIQVLKDLILIEELRMEWRV
jgi:hypothetical protein